MVAHGTIAFDTLTTSDQVNTGTEKSIDTSYIFNGTAKAWVRGNMTSTAVLNDNFNFSSLTDASTGRMQVTLATNMGNINWHFTTCFNNSSSDSNGVHLKAGAATVTTSLLDVLKYENNSATDCALYGCAIFGDLA